ncbi:hypothetical protein OQA88_10568 [Cercophora sp. LCS_1]
MFPQPGYHPHRTIIVDEQIESPETLTIRLEEEAARVGGDLSGDSPTGLLPMSTYKAQPPQLHGYADPPYSQYSAQSFPTQQSENAASQINQLAFAANNAAAGQYLSSSPSISVTSSHPSSGSCGTKVSLRVTSQYDLLGSSMTPFVSVLFGSQRCAADVSKTTSESGGSCTHIVTAEAPQFLTTACPSLSNVPLTLLVENASGSEITRASNVGTFSYNDGQGTAAGGSVGVGVTSPPDLGSPKRSPVQRASPPHQGLPPASTSSPSTSQGLSSVSTTNTYGFPPSLSASQAQTQQTQPDYAADAGTYNQGSGSMLGAYRGASFSDHYARAPPVLRSPHAAGWTPFGSHVEPIRNPAAMTHVAHSSMARSGLTPLQHHNATTPMLQRTSTINQQGNGGHGYHPYTLPQTKATLKIQGDLTSMVEHWTDEEWENKRRLVIFKKHQHGNVLTITFRPVSVAERPPNSICISCIWWQEKGECFVTSVDTIHLLEQLLVAPSRFSVEEKNRIRRNLEGFHPSTVSKAKSDSEEFFKIIMGFGNPKPRNIEKDVKVFAWKYLGQGLSKIISKYSASTASLATPTTSSHLMAPTSLSASYPSIPPTLGPISANAGESAAAVSYIGQGHHHSGSISSPVSRPLSGGNSSWPTYSSTSRAMSPILKTSSPIPTSNLRISTLPAVYDSRGSSHSLTSPYGSSHHGQGYGQAAIPTTQATRNWDAYSVADGYAAHTSSHGGVYGSSAYGDGTQRA